MKNTLHDFRHDFQHVSQSQPVAHTREPTDTIENRPTPSRTGLTVRHHYQRAQKKRTEFFGRQLTQLTCSYIHL